MVSGVKPEKPNPIYMPSITIFVQYTHQPQIEWKLPKDDSTAKRKSTKHEFTEQNIIKQTLLDKNTTLLNKTIM